MCVCVCGWLSVGRSVQRRTLHVQLSSLEAGEVLELAGGLLRRPVGEDVDAAQGPVDVRGVAGLVP